jgi:hypothetical protein
LPNIKVGFPFCADALSLLCPLQIERQQPFVYHHRTWVLPHFA